MVIKKGHPILQVAVYDRIQSINKILDQSESWMPEIGTSSSSHESQNQSHASYTPDTAWTVSRTPSRLVPEQGEGSGFDVV